MTAPRRFGRSVPACVTWLCFQWSGGTHGWGEQLDWRGISWRICVAGDTGVAVDGRIDEAEHFEDEFVRLSGAPSGGRFVLVTDAPTCVRRPDARPSGVAHFSALRQGVRSSLG